jgi:hypothetical protein
MMPDSEITSPPNLLFEKSGFTAATVVRQINPHTIQIEYHPNQGPLIGFIFSGLLTAAFALMGGDLAYLSGATGLFFLSKMLSCRPIRCEMDIQSGSISYFRSFPEENEQKVLSIDEIREFEIQRRMRRGGIIYQVFMSMDNADKYPLNNSDLSSAECKRLAKKVCKFIEKELPITTADY